MLAVEHTHRSRRTTETRFPFLFARSIWLPFLWWFELCTLKCGELVDQREQEEILYNLATCPPLLQLILFQIYSKICKINTVISRS